MGVVECVEVRERAADDFRGMLAPLGGLGGGGGGDKGRGGDGSRGRHCVLQQTNKKQHILRKVTHMCNSGK